MRLHKVQRIYRVINDDDVLNRKKMTEDMEKYFKAERKNYWPINGHQDMIKTIIESYNEGSDTEIEQGYSI